MINIGEGIGEITQEDREVSATLGDLSSLLKILDSIKNNDITRIIDLGCGYGGLSRFVSRYLNAKEVYGVDIDDVRMSQARSKGVMTYKLDLNKDKLPFQSNFFDLVTSFGALEHLKYFDNSISESHRILCDSGFFILAMPNLGSYLNRAALLFGYQPRDVEISSKLSPGILPYYGGGLIGHVHSATLRASRQMLNHYGFQIIKVIGSSPYQRNNLQMILDRMFSFFPSLSRRFIILAKKQRRSLENNLDDI